MEAEVPVADAHRQHREERRFCIRLNDGTRALEDEQERGRYMAQRWRGA